MRRLRRILDVAAARESAARTARQHCRQLRVRMKVAVADAAAVHEQRVIQQRAIAVRRRLEPIQEIREQAHVIRIDLRVPGDFVWHVAVV